MHLHIRVNCKYVQKEKKMRMKSIAECVCCMCNGDHDEDADEGDDDVTNAHPLSDLSRITNTSRHENRQCFVVVGISRNVYDVHTNSILVYMNIYILLGRTPAGRAHALYYICGVCRVYIYTDYVRDVGYACVCTNTKNTNDA